MRKIELLLLVPFAPFPSKKETLSHAPEVESQIRDANSTSLSTCSSSRSTHDTPYSDPREKFLALFFKRSKKVIEPHSEWRQQMKPMCWNHASWRLMKGQWTGKFKVLARQQLTQRRILRTTITYKDELQGDIDHRICQKHGRFRTWSIHILEF